MKTKAKVTAKLTASEKRAIRNMLLARPSPEDLARVEFDMGRLFILPGGRINHDVYPLLGRVMQALIDSGEVPADILRPTRAS